MKVKVLLNYEDKLGDVHLRNEILEINKSDFKPHLHSEDVITKKTATKARRKTKSKTEPSEDKDVR